jgi:hypothetical protein
MKPIKEERLIQFAGEYGNEALKELLSIISDVKADTGISNGDDTQGIVALIEEKGASNNETCKNRAKRFRASKVLPSEFRRKIERSHNHREPLCIWITSKNITRW